MPERLEIKHELYRDIEDALEPQAIVASSASGLTLTEMQGGWRSPGRFVLGHPFNPPHLIPLVEVVGGKETSDEAVERAINFYRAIGKKPIHIRREVKGHVANRLQAALWREAFYLVDQGIASVSDIDTAIAHGPGLRWALLGPFLNLHLSGGSGGIGHVIDHLGPPIESWWRDLGDLSFTPKVKTEAMQGVEDELSGRELATLQEERDDTLIQLLALKAQAPQLP